MDGFLINLIYLCLIFLAFYIATFSKWRIRPVAMAENDVDFIDRQLNAMNEQQRIAQPNNINVRPIEIPFIVEFNLLKSTSKDGIYFKIKQFSNSLLNKNINLVILWSLDINKFYSKFENSIHDSFYGQISEFFKDSCVKVYHSKLNNLESDRELYYEIPEECNESFKEIESNNTLRNVYHVAVILFKDDIESISFDSVIANINIYHLKDKKMETRLLHNYLKCLNNTTISLTSVKSQEEELCVVCQVNQNDQVLLPCTHKCICSECLVRIPDNKCPMCRVQIHNKFQLRG
ncbi:unnamed protein product [Brachionus calyciflorus]|uniref:RING-type domain-containing protein n=1 Tax=Brachionus calyciflorus TaxID=104777 RepID=A0A813XY45_9BILA|nr:unnamed protein product [Brachionus calyciflorus]